MRSCALCFTVLFAIMITACQSGVAPLSDEDVATIRSYGPAIDQLALAGDWSAFVEMFTPDGIVLPANAPVIRGRSELQAMIESAAMTVAEHTIEFVDVDGYGDIAYARGTYSETYSVEGVSEPIADSGKILAVLRKQPDGSWLFSVWMWNSDLPLAQAAGEHSEGAGRN